MVNKGLGNSGGWGKGPSTLGLLLYANNQQETATATATRDNRAVIMRERIKPTIDTQTSSDCMIAAVKEKRDPGLEEHAILKYGMRLNYVITFEWICKPFFSTF